MKTKRGRPQAPYKLYTVYNNNTDMPIIVDGTAAECAAAMGLKTVGNFFNTVVRARNGYLKKWTILSRKRKEVEHRSSKTLAERRKCESSFNINSAKMV